MHVPTSEEFQIRTSDGRPMPVYRDLLADMETPLSAYWKLAHDETFSFLLESVTGGEHLARYSILGVGPKTVVRTKDRQATISRGQEQETRELAEGEDPLHLLQSLIGDVRPHPVPGMPNFIGGAVGMLGYDLVRFFERLPGGPKDDLGLDDLAMMIVDTVVIFDHAKNLIRVIVTAAPGEYDRAVSQIDAIIERLRRPIPPLPKGSYNRHPVKSNFAKPDFEAVVSRMREYIAAGDGVQMVPSQRFSTPIEAHPLTLYRALRSINPSPYMFLLRFGDFDLVGASPELMVSLHGETARVRPIAGTRWRGETPEADQALADELLEDEKERAEHVMLVDLGRNDLGRVCEIGTVHVDELMVIERYSHVMHIVSNVTGKIRKGSDAYDLMRATFPAGTVSGAPKVRAMQVIDELEPTRRASYAGAIGFFSFSGDLDSCIAIRTVLVKDGIAHVQAGCGVVYDSVPEREYEETCNKARAALRAIEMAQEGL